MTDILTEYQTKMTPVLEAAASMLEEAGAEVVIIHVAKKTGNSMLTDGILTGPVGMLALLIFQGGKAALEQIKERNPAAVAAASALCLRQLQDEEGWEDGDDFAGRV